MSEHIAHVEEGALARKRIGAVLRWLWARLPQRVRRYLAARFGDVSRAEAIGYAVWGAMGVAVGVPEIWAAVAGSDFYWPTISTTVGHLQDRWPVVALIPVALIVMGSYSVYRVGAASVSLQADLRALTRTPEGRLTKDEVSFGQLARGVMPAATGRRQWDVLPYFVLASIAVIVTAFIASASDNRFLVGYVLYSLIAVVWVIIPNVAAYWFRRDVPFTTLFFTIRCLGRRLQFVAALILGLLVILLLHLAFYPWPAD